MIDLHIHSIYSSDAEFSPTELVRRCKDAGVTMMSITDHNCAGGNKEARQAAEKLQIQYISGIEIDCMFNGINLHLLGYEIADESPDFEQLDKNNLAQEKGASYERLKLTRRLGFQISESELNKIANIEDDRGVWAGEVFSEVLLADQAYKEHKLLLPYRAGGVRGDNPYANFYWDYYAQGKPCYAERNFPDLKEAISLIKGNGGKAVLAHPGVNLKNRYELFNEIVSAGIDGVEVFSSYHDKETSRYFYEQALRHSLMVTCGSDYHGKTKPSVKLGEVGCRIDTQEMKMQLNFS